MVFIRRESPGIPSGTIHPCGVSVGVVTAAGVLVDVSAAMLSTLARDFIGERTKKCIGCCCCRRRRRAGDPEGTFSMDCSRPGSIAAIPLLPSCSARGFHWTRELNAVRRKRAIFRLSTLLVRSFCRSGAFRGVFQRFDIYVSRAQLRGMMRSRRNKALRR